MQNCENNKEILKCDKRIIFIPKAINATEGKEAHTKFSKQYIQTTWFSPSKWKLILTEHKVWRKNLLYLLIKSIQNWYLKY